VAEGTGAGGGRREAGSAPGPQRGPEVVVALDFPDAPGALGMVDRLPPGTWCKVGLELFAAAGPDLVRRLVERGHPLFLDLKLHDIPNTVAGSVRAATRLGVRLLTVHAAGGREMIRAAVEASAEASAEFDAEVEPRILAVTVLTSLDDALLEDVMGAGARVEEAVGRLAALARGAGAAGAVASVAECSAVKAICGPEFRVATPGIRLPGGASHDQRRVATPDRAREAGADWLVVGRAVTRAEDPTEALRRVRALAAEAGADAETRGDRGQGSRGGSA